MLYRWRRSYCGIGISAAQSHKDLEQEHPLPQAAAAERMLNVDVLKALLTKNACEWKRGVTRRASR